MKDTRATSKYFLNQKRSFMGVHYQTWQDFFLMKPSFNNILSNKWITSLITNTSLKLLRCKELEKYKYDHWKIKPEQFKILSFGSMKKWTRWSQPFPVRIVSPWRVKSSGISLSKNTKSGKDPKGLTPSPPPPPPPHPRWHFYGWKKLIHVSIHLSN